MSTENVLSELSVTISDIGGISNRTDSIPPGVTVLAGENATNRSSFLRGVATALGDDRAVVKGDAKEGEVSIELDGDVFSRTVNRRGKGYTYSGTPYLTDEYDLKKAKLFSMLLRDNEIRQYMRTQHKNLRDVLMEPVNTDAIDSEISDLLNRERELEQELDQASNAGQSLSELEDQQATLDGEITELTETIEDIQNEIDEFDRDVDEAEEDNTELKEARQKADSLRARRNDLEQELDSKQSNLKRVSDQLESLSSPDIDEASLRSERDELEEERKQFRKQISRLQSNIKEPLVEIRSVISQLQDESSGLMDSISQFSGTDIDLPDGPLQELFEGGETTDQLVSSAPNICLACGSDIVAGDMDEIDQQYQELLNNASGVISEKRSRQRTVESRISEIEEELSQVSEFEKQQDDLQRRQVSLESRTESIEDEIEAVTEELDVQQETIQELTQEENQELIELHEDRAEARSALESKQNRLQRVQEEISEVERRQSETANYQVQLDDIEEQVDSLRGRVSEIERSLRDEFNERMAEVLDILDYENLDEVKITQQKETVREGRQNVEKTTFSIEITRTGEEGQYMGSLEQLSESELEIVGLVTAVTGYLVHDVGDVCPIVLLDSVDMIDASRLERLLEYIGEYQEYLVAAVLPEEAEALDSDLVTVVDW